jgi:hypothetical protein
MNWELARAIERARALAGMHGANVITRIARIN